MSGADLLPSSAIDAFATNSWDELVLICPAPWKSIPLAPRKTAPLVAWRMKGY